MYTLGINAVYHDPAACLVQDGQVLAAAEEERFTHVKHGKRPVPFSTYLLPFHAIDYCLKVAGIKLADIDHIAYSYDPYILTDELRNQDQLTLPIEPSAHRSDGDGSPWEPLFLSYLVNAPRQLADGAPYDLMPRFKNVRENGGYRYTWHYVDHHLAHAASAFYPSPFNESAVMVLDGRGEKATTSFYKGKGTSLTLLGQVNMPHSLGILYEKFTEYLGFLNSSDEFKVMALASYGEPVFMDTFQEMIQVTDNGTFTIQAPADLEQVFGPRRQKGEPLTQRHYDIASSLQESLTLTALKLIEWLQAETGSQNLCLAGGVALNCVMNSNLLDLGPFEKIWAQPASGDAGTALGAALYVDLKERHCIGETETREYQMNHAFLGPEYSPEEIEKFLRWSKLSFTKPDNLLEEVTDLLVQDKIIGWFQGRMEFGPRALGARSILSSPIPADMKDRLNDIKGRESFRPVAPVVLEEEASKWFRVSDPSPYMLFVFDVLPDKADSVKGILHVDGTARIQTINRSQNQPYYDLLQEFYKRTGVPILVNTSFNTRGEPIVCSPRDALECYLTSPLDALVIGPYLLQKTG